LWYAISPTAKPTLPRTGPVSHIVYLNQRNEGRANLPRRIVLNAAVVVVDMLMDNLKTGKHTGIEQQGMAIVPAIRSFLAESRRRGIPVFYANDSFLSGDALFGGKMTAHAIRGTPGAEVIPEIAPAPGDFIVPKRRFSGFYKTDLDQTLRTLGVDTVAVAGIATHVCVLMTALDAVSHDFRAVILEDCSAAHKREVHEASLNLYRKNALWPLLRVETARQFLLAGKNAFQRNTEMLIARKDLSISEQD
jgi:nicotinamidase-related amidase